MYKIDLPVTRCLPGMVTAEPVIDLTTGLTIVGAEQILTDTIIQKLYKFNYNKICVYVGPWNNIWNVAPEVIEKYEGHRKELKVILDHLTVTKVLDIKALKEIAERMQLDFNQNYTILACINMIRLADEYIYTHSINVALLSMLMGKWMECNEEMIEELILLALVHDVGQERIPEKVLNGTDGFACDDYNQMTKYIRYGYEVLGEIRHNKMEHPVVSQKLQNIINIADIYDAMTTHRIYRKNQSPFEVLELLQNGVFGQLDPEILMTFINNIANYYVGTFVVLSTGEVGEVVFVHPHCVYRPIVRVGEIYIDLHVQHHIKILQIA
ncbi:HD-GYP domain-containing protein [Niameybacter massiliensis]|uniref:HD-GYP domain-containing protein n=1 Tax=Niameybacter massiliensis TaxID=1658108 RepID=UPI0006B6326E|nr:HD domain-containing protein [Niameybacter massiliensis]